MGTKPHSLQSMANTGAGFPSPNGASISICSAMSGVMLPSIKASTSSRTANASLPYFEAAYSLIAIRNASRSCSFIESPHAAVCPPNPSSQREHARTQSRMSTPGMLRPEPLSLPPERVSSIVGRLNLPTMRAAAIPSTPSSQSPNSTMTEACEKSYFLSLSRQSSVRSSVNC